MQKQYAGITSQMLLEIEAISEEISHQGEKGKNNELILAEFLERHLPKRYTVSTGKVKATGDLKSGQIDIIIHDRTNVPALTDGHAWSIVPVEAVHAVIAVKTTLNKTELADALDSIQSVRSLPRRAAVYYPPTGGVMKVLEKDVLRPRAYVFAFKSSWKNAHSIAVALTALLPGIKDDYRPNGVCILDQAFIIRRAYKLDTIVFPQHALMHFFNHLVLTLSTRPIFSVDLSKYITEDYGILSPKGDVGSADVKPAT